MKHNKNEPILETKLKIGNPKSSQYAGALSWREA